MSGFLTRARCLAALCVLGLYGGNAAAGVNESIFRNGFEGGDFPPGAQISGRVISDPNADGDLSDGLPLAGVAVYLDSNYNGRLDDGEPTQFSDASGNYQFYWANAWPQTCAARATGAERTNCADNGRAAGGRSPA